MVHPEHQSSSVDQDEAAVDRTDPTFLKQVENLHHLTVYSRWILVAALWLSVGVLSLWSVRHELELLSDYFTWAALRYAVIFNRWPAIGLATCIGMTVSVLVWQSRNILWGLPQIDRDRLKTQVLKIRQQGPKHPLWTWINRD
jgi:hypothetical protein